MTDQPKLGLNKHTFIPSPPTEAEQMAWSVADSRAQACRQLQQRVDELEREVNSVKELFDQVETHRCLLIETTVELTADLRTASDQCEALSKNLAVKNRQLNTMIEENRRLRELLRQYKHRLDKRWREGTRMDAYARGYQNGLEAAEVIFADVFNAIGPRE